MNKKSLLLAALTVSLMFNTVPANADPVNLEILGQGAADALRNNSASLDISRDQRGGTKVRIDMPARFEAALNSDKIDQLALEKMVTFDMSKDASGNTVLSKIKGFKIHSVEKGMWVNLMNLVIMPQQDAEGKFDAEITAGKAGISKVVASKLPSKAVFPVVALAKAADDMAIAAATPQPTTTPVATQEPIAISQPEPAATTPPPVVVQQPAPIAQPVVQQPVYVAQPVAQQPAPVAQPVVQQPVVQQPVYVAQPVAQQPAPVAQPVVQTVPQVGAAAPASSVAYAAPAKAKRHSDDDEDDNDDDDNSQEDDHLILHLLGKGLKVLGGNRCHN